MLYTVWHSGRSGSLFLFDYEARTNFLRGRKADEIDLRALNFKLYGHSSDHIRIVVSCLKEALGAETSIAVAPHATEESSIQRACDRDVFLKPLYKRPTRHNRDFRLTFETERPRIKTVKKKAVRSAILCDDVLSTGLTMEVYRRILEDEGIECRGCFAVGHTKTDRSFRYGVFIEKESVLSREISLDFGAIKSGD